MNTTRSRILRPIVFLLALMIILSGALLSGCSLVKTPQATTQTSDTTTVIRVVDGDTFMIAGDQSVRLLGINCPESHDKGGPEATAYTKSLIEGKAVRLVSDAEDKDQYGRLLRYAYLNDIFVNQKIVEDGYAVAVYYEPNGAHRAELEQAQRVAEENKTGLWQTAPDALVPNRFDVPADNKNINN